MLTQVAIDLPRVLLFEMQPQPLLASRGERAAQQITGAEVAGAAQHHCFGKLPISQHERAARNVLQRSTFASYPAHKLRPAALLHQISRHIGSVVADGLIPAKSAE